MQQTIRLVCIFSLFMMLISAQHTAENNFPEETVPNTLTAEEEAKGWTLLFDGQTTEGWRNYQKSTIGEGWKVADGALYLDVQDKEEGHWQGNGGDIITEGQYENYDLRMEWKIGECGNSGIIYNVVELGSCEYVWQTGPEIQLLDNPCHPDGKLENHRAGSLYDMIAPSKLVVKPAGEWNKMRLKIKNGKVTEWLNGKKIVEYEMFTPKWEEMIANSKFKDMPNFGKARKGHIALQDHGNPVWFRNIKIKELK